MLVTATDGWWDTTQTRGGGVGGAGRGGGGGASGGRGWSSWRRLLPSAHTCSSRRTPHELLGGRGLDARARGCSI